MNPLNNKDTTTNTEGDEENAGESSASANLIRFWLEKNVKEVPSFTYSETFVDQKGVQRYTANWSEVKEQAMENKDKSPIESAARRGAVAFIFLNEARTLISVFACDYKKVWNASALDDTRDDFGSYVLLFQTLVLIFFDKRSMHYYFLLNIYLQILFVAILIFAPESAKVIIPQQIMLLLFAFSVYACGKLNKRDCYSQLLSADQIEECKCKRKLRTSSYAQNSTKQMYELSEKYPYWILIKTCFSTMLREFRILRGGESDYMEVHMDRATSHGDEEMQIINVQSKESTGRDILDRLDEPIECKYYLLLNVAVRFLQFHDRHGTIDMPNGGRHILVKVFTIIPLIILANASYVFFGFDCIFPSPSRSYLDLDSCLAQYMLFYGTFGTIVFVYIYMFGTLVIMLSLVGMMYGARILHELAALFVNRYSPLRQLSMEDEDEMIDINDISISKDSVRLRLTRDATEHYLFIKEFVRQASALYSPFIVGAMLACSISLMFMIYSIVTQSNNTIMVLTAIMSGTICSFVILFPIYCIAYANSAMSKMVNCFTHGSGPDDFKCIGGKEQWLSHLVDSPAYWTIFGMPVTFGMFYSIGTSIGGAAAFTAFSWIKYHF